MLSPGSRSQLPFGLLRTSPYRAVPYFLSPALPLSFLKIHVADTRLFLVPHVDKGIPVTCDIESMLFMFHLLPGLASPGLASPGL